MHIDAWFDPNKNGDEATARYHQFGPMYKGLIFMFAFSYFYSTDFPAHFWINPCSIETNAKETEKNSLRISRPYL